MELAASVLERLAAARSLVVFTGAGVSQESGLDVFRGPGGSWERFRPEDLATPEAFARDPERVWRWYRQRFEAMRRAEPNPAHRTIARWGECFASLLVVTQNVDGLHQRSGSRDVAELHGRLRDSRCAGCGCIRATAVDSFQHGFRTIVPEDCVGDIEEGPHRENLRDVGRRYVDVVTCEDVIAYLETLPRRNA